MNSIPSSQAELTFLGGGKIVTNIFLPLRYVAIFLAARSSCGFVFVLVAHFELVT